MASFYCVFPLLGFLCIALTVDYVNTQHGHGRGGSHMTTAGPYDPTTAMTTVAGGEVEFEAEEIITTTAAMTTTKKPKPRRRRPKKQRGGKRRRKPKTQAQTQAPTTTPQPTTLSPTTIAPVTQPLPSDNGRGPNQNNQYNNNQWGAGGQNGHAGQGGGRGWSGGSRQDRYREPARGANDKYNAYQTGSSSNMHVNVVATQSPTTTTHSYRQPYQYQAHSCPKMDVATWENEVVIYDNINCAIIIRMNPRLRRPTVTFQAPYW